MKRIHHTLQSPLTLAAAVIVISLAAYAPDASARFVNGPDNMCEVASQKRDSRVESEIDYIKKTHEMMGMERDGHASCMKTINSALGDAISKMGGGGILGSIMSSLDKFFDLSGKACSAINKKVDKAKDKLNDKIKGSKPILDKIGSIYDIAKDPDLVFKTPDPSGGNEGQGPTAPPNQQANSPSPSSLFSSDAKAASPQSPPPSIISNTPASQQTSSWETLRDRFNLGK